jgi:large subunit ribosomal protein L19
MAEEIKKEEIAAEVENAEVVEKESTPEIEEKGKEVSDVRPGDTVKVHQKIKEKNKDRIQVFEGQVLARKHGKGISSTITVRKVIDGIGVEKIFPLHSPSIEKIEIVKRAKARRAKLYYLRTAKGRKAKIKTLEEK